MMRPRQGARRPGERGQVAGIEALPFGLLLFVAGALLVVNIWSVVDTKFAAGAAAREATRYLVESAGTDRAGRDLEAAAGVIARATLEDHGLRRAVVVEVRPATATFTRCRRIRVTIRTTVPAVRLPFVGGFGGPIDVVSTHSEIVDPTRSGVAGPAGCVR
jgi:hypothetical protein